MESVELARNGERCEDGLVGSGIVGESGLLRSPVKEAESERVVVEEEGINDSGYECWGQ